MANRYIQRPICSGWEGVCEKSAIFGLHTIDVKKTVWYEKTTLPGINKK